MDRINNFIVELQKDCPKLNIDYKNKSSLMKVLSILLFFNKDFFKKYITTIDHTIYFPNEELFNRSELNSIIIMAHEYTHIKDSESMGNFKYSFLYLIPQIFALLAIPFAFFIGLYSLFFLLFLLPWPAYWRKNIELKGYITTLFVEYYFLTELNYPEDEKNEKINNSIESINKAFTGPGYYWMWPFGVKNTLSKTINSSEINNNRLLIHIKEILDKSKV